MCFAGAAYGNNDSILQYLFDNKCPWDFMTFPNLARHGNVKWLKIAYENGASTSFHAYLYVFMYQQKEAFLYIKSLGIPVPPYDLEEARKLGWI